MFHDDLYVRWEHTLPDGWPPPGNVGRVARARANGCHICGKAVAGVSRTCKECLDGLMVAAEAERELEVVSRERSLEGVR